MHTEGIPSQLLHVKPLQICRLCDATEVVEVELQVLAYSPELAHVHAGFIDQHLLNQLCLSRLLQAQPAGACHSGLCEAETP